MITKREIEYIASGLRNIQPMARDYAPETMREANAAVAQWRKDVESVANMLELAQQRAVQKAGTTSADRHRRMFNKAQFLRDCGIESAPNNPTAS